MKYVKRLIVATMIALIVAGLFVGVLGTYQRLHHRALVAAEYPPPPEGMVFVPPGEFLTGSDDPAAPDDQGPLRTQFLPAFYIDQFEVTQQQYKAFKPDHVIPEGNGQFPITGLSLEEARAYAHSVGKRLPTNAEWEKSARGTDGRLYPWGDTFEAGRANLGGNDGLVDVGSYPKGASPYGAHDMTGNAWEWVETPYVQTGIFGERLFHTEIIKGGAFSYSPFQGQACYNGFEGIGGTCNDVGFRCVMDAKAVRR